MFRQIKTHVRNYLTHNLELATVVFALRTWHHYLYGTSFMLLIDNKSLKYIFTKNDLNMRQRKWLELLFNYDVQIVSHEGKANVLAVTFSRQPVQRVVTCATMRVDQNIVDRDPIAIIAKMTIEASVMDHIRIAQWIDGLPDQWIAAKVHLGLARDMEGHFRIHGQLYVPEVLDFLGLHSEVLRRIMLYMCSVPGHHKDQP